VAVLAVACAQAYAADTFVIKDIRVEGLQRTEPGTVFSYLPFRVGDAYSPENGAAAIRALFATGLFKDVRIRTDGDVVTIIVEERPVIAGVDFVGTKEFPKKTLVEALSQVGLGEARRSIKPWSTRPCRNSSSSICRRATTLRKSRQQSRRLNATASMCCST
jgi:Outer membrane protein/protective antigen OMA87